MKYFPENDDSMDDAPEEYQRNEYPDGEQPYIPESRQEAENTDWDGDYSVYDGDGEEY